MYKIYNNVDDKIIFQGKEIDFIEFVKDMVEENKNYDYSILGVSDAIEYIEDYCNGLQITTKVNI